MTPQMDTPAAKEEPAALRTDNDGDSSAGGSLAGPVGIIPVGQEPPRQPIYEGDGVPKKQAGSGRREGQPTSRPRDKDRNIQPPIRDPDAFYAYKNRLDEMRVFREETMQKLSRAEICVWLAIHGCQHDAAAQISQQRIAELAGISGKRHVGKAIERLCSMGLLEVLCQGRYRPNGSDGHGLASTYRAYPRPEPRLLNRAKQKPK